MAGAFQADAFQFDAFQIDGSAPATGPDVGGVGHGKGRGDGKGTKPRRKVYVKIDDELFEVASEADALQLIQMAHAAAQEAAQKAAEKAVKRAAKATKPAQKARALRMPSPQVEVVDPGYSDDFTHLLRAQVDAVRAQITQIYANALVAAQIAAARDEAESEEVGEILRLDAAEGELLAAEFLKMLKKRR